MVYGTLPIDRQGLTPFTYSRFLVPHLCEYQGRALFLDLDILCIADIAELFAAAEDEAVAVSTVNTDPTYERAAVMLFNCGHLDNAVLTPEAVNTRNDLHLIGWTKARGNLDPRWNHLVGYDARRTDPYLIHYTMGVPAHKETQDCEHADLWKAERDAMNATQDWQTLMGRSAHAERVRKGVLACH